ncbi:MAG: hypothetical protein ACOH5I_00065 [Oligoflexus sp.]
MKSNRNTLPWALSSLIGLSLLTQSSPSLAIDKLPTDGTLQAIRAEKLEEPYQTDEYYAYSKSPSFSRWVYSPWTSPNLDEDKGLVVSDIQSKDKRAVLISEFNIGTSHLEPGKQYQVFLEKDYTCGPSESVEDKPCTLQFVVRCYGKTKDSDWGITFEKTTQRRVNVGEGQFKNEPTIFPADQCQQGLYVSSEATISPESDLYTFKELRVGLKDNSMTTAKK